MDHLDYLIELKTELYKKSEAYLEEKITRISNSLLDLDVALKSESKSSAGDKFETGREMINIEIQKLSTQLQQFQQLQVTLEMAKRNIQSSSIRLGSIVKASNATYFIAIPIGEVDLGKEKVYIIGANSPVAQVLIGKSKGESFTFNNVTNKIMEVS